jgi:PDZ domain/Aspartyl protease
MTNPFPRSARAPAPTPTTLPQSPRLRRGESNAPLPPRLASPPADQAASSPRSGHPAGALPPIFPPHPHLLRYPTNDSPADETISPNLLFAVTQLRPNRLRRPAALHQANPVATFHFTPADEMVLIKTTWDGKPADFIFDTGSSTSLLDSTIFTSLTLAHDQATGKTANGDRVEELYNPPDLSLGPLHLAGAGPVVRMDLSAVRAQLDRPVIGLWGCNVWHKLVAQIDFDNGELRFFEPDDFPHPEWGNAIPLETPQGLDQREIGQSAYVRLTIGPFEDLFMIDTGNTQGGAIPTDGFDRILHATTRPVASAPAVTANGTATIRNLRTPEFILGENHYRDQIFVATTNWFGGLGLDFLSRHLVTIDFPHARLYLKPGKAFNRHDTFTTSGMDLKRQQGQTVVTITPKSPADLAGLRDGDILLKVNGKDAASYELFDLRELLRSKEGTEIDVLFLRDGKTHSATFKLHHRLPS